MHVRLTFNVLSSAAWFLCLLSVCYTGELSTNSGSFLNNCTRQKGFHAVDVSLLTLNGGISSDGVVQVAIPSSNSHHAVCFPKPKMESYEQFSYFAHVLCRQLGYTTYLTWYDKEIRRDEMWDLQLGNFKCHGYEQSLAQCEWDNVTLSTCDRATAVHCYSCYNTIEDTEGVISSPGYPYGYFYTVMCEWNIVAPKGHQLSLNFRKFHLPLGRYTTCEDEIPYLEVVSPSGKSWRFCAVRDVDSLKLIDQREIKIRFYSGVYYETPLEKRKDYGFNIVFKAEKVQQSSQTVKAVIISSGILIFLVMTGLCYITRKCYKRDFKRRLRHEIPDMFDELGPQISSVKKAQEMPVRLPSSNKENHPLTEKVRQKENGSKVVHAVVHSAGPQRNDGDFTPCGTQESNLAGTYKMDRNKRVCRSKLKTLLLSKFTPRSRGSSSNCTPTPKSTAMKPESSPPPLNQGPGFQIYHSLSSASDLEDNYCRGGVGQDGYHYSKMSRVSNSCDESELVCTMGAGCPSPSYDDSELSSSRNNKRTPGTSVPTIVVECVDEKPSN